MVDKITKDIYRIGVTLPESPLKELNTYLLKGRDRDILVDTGYRRPECRNDLLAGLEELGVNRDKLDIILTHLHSDHTGLAGEITGPDTSIFINPVDLVRIKKYLDPKDLTKLNTHNRFVREGFDEDRLNAIDEMNPAFTLAAREIDGRFKPLYDGDIIKVGDYELKALTMAGHTPGNTMLWIESEGIMFTGDHVLFDITPNITAWENVEDSLGDYLESLDKAFGYPVKIALPGHRKPGDYHERINSIKAHHERRLSEVIRALEENPGLTAYEIAGHMTWKIRAKSGKWDDFPGQQQWFAVGECFAHMDYLVKRNRVIRKQEGPVIRYYLV